MDMNVMVVYDDTKKDFSTMFGAIKRSVNVHEAQMRSGAWATMTKKEIEAVTLLFPWSR